jgi:hypothetical protein
MPTERYGAAFSNPRDLDFGGVMATGGNAEEELESTACYGVSQYWEKQLDMVADRVVYDWRTGSRRLGP